MTKLQADMRRWHCSYPPRSNSDARRAARFRFSQVVATIFVWSLASVLTACTVDDQSEVALPNEGAYPESISAGPDGSLYVSSLARGGVWRIQPESETVEEWIAPGAFGTRSTLGVLVDARANLLWVCSNDLSMWRIPGPSQIKGSFVKGFDLTTREATVSARLPGDATLCNDLAIGRDGSLFITNSLAPQILRLRGKGSELEIWIESSKFAQPRTGSPGLDGIAFGDDGNLYVNNFETGDLFRIEVSDGAAGEITKLKPSRRLKHPDALRSSGRQTFLTVEGPGQVARLAVEGDHVDVRTIKTGITGPTSVILVKGILWITEGQLPHLFEAAKKGAPRLPFRILGLAYDNEGAASRDKSERRCPESDLSLPQGFCASVFADQIGHARHIAVASDGTVFVNTWSGVFYGNDTPPPGGFLVALKDTKGVGHADVSIRFGPTFADGARGGTGLWIYKSWLYAESGDQIVRYDLKPGEIVPSDEPQTVVRGIPLDGEHPMRPFAIDAEGNLFLSIGSATNACQVQNRQLQSPGNSPCAELDSFGGIWRYSAETTDQAFSPNERFASGIRNGEGFDFDDAGRLFVTQHGRDLLHENWPQLYSTQRGSELPAEELVVLRKNANYGWPYCYYDGAQKKRVLAPEYGGDGGERGSDCAKFERPVASFPAHWAPNDLKIYKQSQFPESYRGGAFIAFHGSWNRAEGPQGGYNIVFQPLRDGQASGEYVVFADGFAGKRKHQYRALHRPSGLAVAPDGALFVSDDKAGRIWRITYTGASTTKASKRSRR
jgi:glucose/arabinose dehydrogenase